MKHLIVSKLFQSLFQYIQVVKRDYKMSTIFFYDKIFDKFSTKESIKASKNKTCIRRLPKNSALSGSKISWSAADLHRVTIARVLVI